MRRSLLFPILLGYVWLGLLFLLAGPAAAQQAQPATMMHLTELVGRAVVNPAGRSLGEIDDVILARRPGEVLYAVLKHDGRLYPYPLTAFRPTPEGKALVLKVPRDALAGAGGGLETRVEPTTEPALRASALLGRPVVHADGTDAGEIDDVVLDLRTGEVRHALIEYASLARPSPTRMAVSLDELALPQRGPAVLHPLQEPRKRPGFRVSPSDERQRLHSPFTP